MDFYWKTKNLHYNCINTKNSKYSDQSKPGLGQHNYSVFWCLQENFFPSMKEKNIFSIKEELTSEENKDHTILWIRMYPKFVYNGFFSVCNL